MDRWERRDKKKDKKRKLKKRSVRVYSKRGQSVHGGKETW